VGIDVGSGCRDIPESAGPSAKQEKLAALSWTISMRVTPTIQCQSRGTASRLRGSKEGRAGIGTRDRHDDDRRSRDALAALGYCQAFQKVKKTVGEVIAGGSAAPWYARPTRSGTANCFSPAKRLA
jgi:hypothetical protein